nr:MAG TPA: hypothetical protein [Caudoviricetes sp.]
MFPRKVGGQHGNRATVLTSYLPGELFKGANFERKGLPL